MGVSEPSLHRESTDSLITSPLKVISVQTLRTVMTQEKLVPSAVGGFVGGVLITAVLGIVIHLLFV